MNRNMNINQLRRLKETGNADMDELQSSEISPSKRRKHRKPSSSATSGACTLATLAPSLEQGRFGGAANVQTEHATIRKGEEIASLFMQVADKKERCLNFDLQHWLTTYQAVRREVNFPEAAMLVACSAQIYGRKVDYLSDIIVHMKDDQKAREQKESTAANGEGGGETEAPSTTNVRKRAGRFNPQLLSDCFGDLEFTCSDKKLLKLETLIKPPQTVEVDRRTMVQQMQDLCSELRAHPSRQRRQEILNRLRDDACIAPMLSSHGVARKNQILDLESGETIGTRYDYQIHQNYIDGRTGSLIAEHDLKRFFQRCDVIDFLCEQLDSERERCSRLGMPAPADMLSVRTRELKIFMPPEYLKDRYRINVNDTSDFDNALVQARITNYSSDPILSLMDPAEREKRCKEIERYGHDSAMSSPLPYHEGLPSSNENGNESTMVDISFNDVLTSSRMDETNGATDRTQNSTGNTTQETMETSNENPLEDELLALETDQSQSKLDGEKSASTASRLSVDEGIGAECESPSHPASNSQTTDGKMLFTSGTIVSRKTLQRPVQLRINLFGLPEKLVQKNGVFALPVEYRKLKVDLTRRGGERTTELAGLNVYSLHPTAPYNPLWAERPSTPELEDFMGFTDEEAPDRSKKPSTPESSLEGFTDQEIAHDRKTVAQWQQLISKDLGRLASPHRSPKRQQTGDQPSSQPVTPSRTLSCDSGISDTVDRGKEPAVTATNSALEPILSEHEDGFFDSGIGELDAADGQPLKEHTEASNARIQQSIDEAKERIEKVNRWHKKLKPILIESEKRNHFDIHAYGTEIIDTFDELAADGGRAHPTTDDLQRPTITLTNVLQNKPAHSTARYFLSMLMLANTNNVEIVNKNRDSLRLSTTDEIELRLVSRKRHHKEMEALGEMLPNETDHERVQRKRQNRKRKTMLDDHGTEQPREGEVARDRCLRPDVSERLGGSAATVDERNFIDNVQQLYPELNSEESKRKRVAFRRGIRNYAYGLVEEKGSEGEPPSASEQQQQTEPPQTEPQPRPQCNRPATPSLEEDDILAVDVLTNHAMFVPARNTDGMCANSVFSFSESGYESMISEGNISR